MSELRGRLTEHILRARPTGLRDQRTGDLVATAVQGVDALEAYFARYLPQVVLAVLVPVVILAYVFPNDLAAGVILLLTVPMIPLFMILIGLAARTSTEKRWQALSLLSAHFLDVVRGLETLRANDRDRAQEQTLEQAGDTYRRQTMQTLRIAFLSALVLELLAMIGVALVAATVAVQLIDGNITFEVGLAVLLLAPELYLPVRLVGQQFHASADGLAAAGQLFDVLDTPAAVSAPDDPLPAPDPRTAPVALENVTFAHPGRGAPVLDGVSLELRPGKLVALVGPSGEGKSTLAALLLRLLDPDEGHVTCDAIDLRACAPEAWRRQVAWVPQRPTLFAGTIADNVRLALPGASDEAVRAAAPRRGSMTCSRRSPDGLLDARRRRRPPAVGRRGAARGDRTRVPARRAARRPRRADRAPGRRVGRGRRRGRRAAGRGAHDAADRAPGGARAARGPRRAPLRRAPRGAAVRARGAGVSAQPCSGAGDALGRPPARRRARAIRDAGAWRSRSCSAPARSSPPSRCSRSPAC